MLIDCDECAMQQTSQCEDCMVTFLLREEPGPVPLDGCERKALGNLAEAGLVPELRMVPKAQAGS
ncbi:MAG: hypothetical protein M3N51_02800 [Actinomycetota bacterium]|nr:hypothetical protein [Actinomycetota bacterium]